MDNALLHSAESSRNPTQIYMTRKTQLLSITTTTRCCSTEQEMKVYVDNKNYFSTSTA